jgi:hypothetical protein
MKRIILSNIHVAPGKKKNRAMENNKISDIKKTVKSI